MIKPIITIDHRDFLKGASTSNFVPDGGFSPDTGAFEINRGGSTGLLLPGRAESEYSTNISSNCYASVVTYRSSVLYAYTIGGSGKIYETTLEGAPAHTLKATESVKTYDNNSDITIFKNSLYITSNTDVLKSNLTFTSGDPDYDWWTATLSKTALTANVPHILMEFEDNLYITDGNLIHKTNGTTGEYAKLTLPAGWVVYSMEVFNGLIYIAASYSSNSRLRNIGVRMFVWDGFSPSWIREIPLQISSVNAMKAVNGNLYIFGNTHIFLFNGTGLRELKNVVEAPSDWHKVCVYQNRLYFLSYLGIKCYDPKYNAVYTILSPSYTYSNINTLIIGNIDYIDIFATTNKFYRYSANTGNSLYFYSNLYYFDVPVNISRFEVNFRDPLATANSYHFYIWQDNGGTLIKEFDVTYASNGAIRKHVEMIGNQLADNIQLGWAYNNSNNRAILSVKLYGEPTERHYTR